MHRSPGTATPQYLATIEITIFLEHTLVFVCYGIAFVVSKSSKKVIHRPPDALLNGSATGSDGVKGKPHKKERGRLHEA